MDESGVHSNISSTVNFVSFTVKVLGLQLFHYLPYDFSGGALQQETADDRRQEWLSLKKSQARHQFLSEKLYLHPKLP